MSKSAIYGIYVGGRVVYIGCTTNPNNRMRTHANNARKQNRKDNPTLYTCLYMCLVKGVPFRFKIIEVCDRCEMLSREFYHINKNRDKLFAQSMGTGKHKRQHIEKVKTQKIVFKSFWRAYMSAVSNGVLFNAMTKQVA